MAYIRGQERMVGTNLFVTVEDYLTETLNYDNNPNPLPWGMTEYLEFIEDALPAEGVLGNAHRQSKNTVAFYVAHVFDDEAAELGGGLQLTEYVMFFDIWAESVGIARAIASDIKAVLTGQLSGTNRYTVMTNGIDNTPTDALIEVTDVTIERPVAQPQDEHWMVVKVTAELQWDGQTE